MAERFAVALLALALAIVLLPELAFVHDVFAARINSVFKFYFQAWALLAVTSAFAIVRFRSRSGARTWLVWASLALIASSASYLPAALQSKRAGWTGAATLDGLAHLPAEERQAIDWIRRWTRADAVIVQAAGTSYRADHDRLSAATGRATLIGWQGHEVQWRGSSFGELSEGRFEALETIYRSGDAAQIEDALRRFSVDYVVVGAVERELYGIDAAREATLGELLEPVFEAGAIRILRVARPATAGG